MFNNIKPGQTSDEMRREMLQVRKLLLPDNENIGKKVKIKDVPETNELYPYLNKDHNYYVIVCCQRLWGYNEKGQYTMLDGYRITSIKDLDGFGIPIDPKLIYFID